MYVLKCTDDDNPGYVADSGSNSSYTRQLHRARTFRTAEAAERERCGNEVIVTVDSQLSAPER